MKIHEHQAKQLMAARGIPVPEGRVARSVDEAVAAVRPLIEESGNPVVVLKSQRILHLMDGNRLLRSYAIDLGAHASGPKRLAGDGRTPEGAFRVVSKNGASKYTSFIGIDYPNREATEWGFDRGLISEGEAESIRAALKAGRPPNWSTALGGGIGIHGDRRGFDWTGGCIAIDTAHVRELFDVLRIGDPVEILP